MAVWFKEQEPYTKENIKNKLLIYDEKGEKFEELFNYLISNKIIKKKGKENKDNYEEYDDFETEQEIEESQNYAFYYVGIVNWNNYSIRCYPKYIKNSKDLEKDFPLILKIIEKYKKEVKKEKRREEPNYLFSDLVKGVQVNRLELELQILNYYFEHGLYYNSHTVYEKNGNGEIKWDMTINQCFPLFCNARPFYYETINSRQISDNTNYICQLHKYIITECTKDLLKGDLLNLLGLDEIFLTEAKQEDFGEIDYILYKIQNEYKTQFVTWKQDVLKLLYTYMCARKTNDTEAEKGFYGTKYFHTIWEDVCKKVFLNTQEKTIFEILKDIDEIQIDKYKEKEIEIFEKGEIGKKIKKQKVKYLDAKLINLISCPKWIKDENEAYAATLIPDLISINKYEGGKCFSILDAKYYDIEINNNSVKNNPGVGDVTKQYLYQLSYNNFIVEHNFDYIQNLFLCPGEKEDFEYGTVQMEIFNCVGDIKLENIKVVKLPAIEIYKKYLIDTKLNKTDIYNYLPKPSKIRDLSEEKTNSRLLSYINLMSKEMKLSHLDLNTKTIIYIINDLLEKKGKTITEKEKNDLVDILKNKIVTVKTQDNNVIIEEIKRIKTINDLYTKEDYLYLIDSISTIFGQSDYN